MKLGGTLPGFQLAYETWGALSPARDNVVLLATGLSPSSHAPSRPYAAVGSSMGGMQALACAAEFPGAVERVVAISAAARSYPLSIAIRFIQRQAILADPDWNGGNYYGGMPPLHGMRVARELGMI